MSSNTGAEGKSGVVETLLREVGFYPPYEPRGEPDRGATRIVASGSIALAGLALLVPNVVVLFTGPTAAAGTSLSLLGTVVSSGLVAGGYALYRSRFTNRNAARIALWNLLGIVVLGSVMLGLFAYQADAGGRIENAPFTLANLLSIGAAAHVVIGVYDARRVRAEALAVERRKLDVLNRVLRHNLRNEATVLVGHADNILDDAEDESVRASAETLKRHAETVGRLSDEADVVMDVYDRGAIAVEPRNLRTAVDDAVAVVRDEHPDADVSVDVPDDLRVEADAALSRAIEELVENGVVHNDSEPPRVQVEAERDGGDVVLEVRDDGPGIPLEERELVTGDREITQLSHGSGLGLWIVRAVADVSRADLSFDEWEEGGLVRLRFRAA